MGSRIIPALAGNTAFLSRHCFIRGDHPRSRGEYGFYVYFALHGLGSSPLSRGIQPLFKCDSRPRGIIPALAGNTDSEYRNIVDFGDHPRSRGEYYFNLLILSTIHGSSPLSRGIRLPALLIWQPRRIIPALAGNTKRPSNV